MYGKLIAASVRSQMEYKVSFWMEMLIFMILQGIDFLLVAAILLKFDRVGGWNLYEVGYLFAVASMVRSLYRVFGNELHNFDKYTQNGEFDQLLTRPLSPLLLLFSRNIHLNQLGGFLQGILMLAICLWGLQTQGTHIWPALLYLPVSLVFGTLIVFALGLLTSTLAFWMTTVQELLAFTHYGPLTAAGYPASIYPDWLKGVLFTLIPVAFISYVPSLYLFDKGGSAWLLLLTPVVAVAAFYAGLRFWRFGIRQYQSTGS